MIRKIQLFFSLVLLLIAFSPEKNFAQSACSTCTGVTTFTANLSATPNNTYTVTSGRNGLCCQGAGSDRCIRFEVTVHPLATQIQFLVSTGNNGTWQINCGGTLYTPASQPCLGGLTNFCITYCNPGGAADTYTITTSSGFSAGADINLRAGCAGLLTVGGLNESSITWNSVSPGTSGQYNSYLSCTSACDTSIITPAAGAPTFVDYRVCGTATGCSVGTYCDTQRVYISPALTVSVTPATPALCSSGSGSLTLTATPTGGAAPYSYSWNPGGATTQTVSVSSAGTYTVSVNDQATGCGAVTQTVTVASVTTPTATATPSSQTICSGAATNIALTSTEPGTTYSWTVSQTGVSGAAAGSGAAIAQTLTTTGTSPGTATYTITPSANGCVGPNIIVTVTVNPIPTATATPTSQSICSSAASNIALSSNVSGTTFSWTVTQTGVSGASASSGAAIAQTLSTTAAAQGTAIYTITPSANSCPGTSVTATVTVNPIPLMTSAGTASICSGGTVSIPLTADVASTFSWIAANNANTSGESTTLQSSSTLSNTITNSTTTAQNVIYTVTPTSSGGGCTGNPQTVTVTVNPTPTMTSASSATICSGGTVSIALTADVASGFSWIASDNVNTTGESTSVQNTATLSNTITNLTSAVQTVTYTVTPTSTSGSCAGTPQTVTITVNPTPAMTSASSATICGGGTVSIPLTSNIASTYTWIAADNANTNGESTTLQTTGTLSNTITTSSTTSQSVIYTVTPTSSSGSCAGIAQTVTVTVNPIPVMTSATSATICSGGTVSIPLTSNIASTYIWIAADNANTSGESTSAQTTSTLSNTITNSTGTIQTVIYTVTPTSSAGSCTGPTQTVTVTVNPTPVVTSASSATICSGGSVNISLTANVASTFTWIAGDNANTTGESTSLQSTATLNNTITNNSSAIQTVTYTVTPTTTAGSCPGTPQSVTVTVNPTPVMTSAGSASICSGGTVSIPLTANISSTFSWIAANNANTSGESTSAQTTSTLSNTITNATALPQTVSYTVTPTSVAGNCPGTPQTVTVTVNPAPVMTSATSATICSGSAVNISLTSNVVSTFSWLASDNVNTSGESTTAQSGNTINNTITNSGTSVETVIYTVTPTSTTGSCAGSPQTVTVTVNPTPVVTSTNSASICSGSTINIPLTSNIPSTFTWIAANNANTTGESTTIQTSSAINNTIVSTSTVAQTVIYTITPTSTAATCAGTPQTVTITVNPVPAPPTASNNGPVCLNATVNLFAGNVTGATYSWTGPNGFTSSSQNPSIANSTLTDAGTYSVSVTVAGCTSTFATTSVIVNPPPTTPTPSSNSPVCAGQTLTLTTNTLTAATYSWTGPNSFSSTLQNPTITGVTTAATGTYSVIATVPGCGTTAAGTVAVTINPTPATPTVTSNGPLCVGATLNLTASTIAGATYNWTGPNAFSSALQNPSITNVTISESGTYSVTATANGCTSVAGTVSVTVNPIPLPPNANSNSPACIGNSINLSASTVAGATYNWTGPNGFTSSTQNPVISNAQSTDAGTYSVTVNVAGCTSPTATVNVVVNPIPAAPTASGIVICQGTADTLAATAPGGTYEWYTASTGGTFLGSGATYVTPTLTTNTTYFVQTTVNGCTSPRTAVSVTVSPVPAAPTVSGTTICEGTNTTLNATAPGGNYAWYDAASGGSLLSNTSSYTTPTLTTTTTYYVNTTIAGCTGPNTAVTVSVTPTDDPSFSYSSGTYCQTGTNPTPTITGGATGTFSALPAGLVFTNSSTGTINLSASALNTYTVTFTTNGACPSSSSMNITVTTAPDASFSYATPFCQGGTDPLPAFIPGASAGVFSASPAGLSFNNTSSGEIDLTASAPGTYTITNFIAAAGGCASAISTNTITINPMATVSAGSDQIVCDGSTVTLTGILGGSATSATWSGGIGSFSNNNLLNAVYTPNVSETSVTLVLTTNDPAGPCSSITDTMQININPIPVAPTTDSAVICAGNTATLNATAPGGTYGWFNAPTGGTQVGTGTSFTTPTLTTTTTYYVQTTVAGCAGPRTAVTVTVNPIPTAPTAAGASVCTGDAAMLTATAPGGTYEWFDAASGGNLLATNASFSTPALTTTTTYYVQSTIAGCTGPMTAVTVTVNPYPAAPTALNGSTCDGSTALLTATAPGGTYQWYDAASGGTLLFTGANYTTPALTVTTTYYVQTTVNGCTGPTTAVTAVVNPIPSAPTATGNTICEGMTAVLNATAPGGTYTWYNQPTGGSALGSGTAFTTATLTTTTTFYVQTTVNGCSSTRTAVTVTVIATDDPSFSYSSGTFCITGTNPLPTITGGSTGTFSGTPAGLSFVSSTTGEIDLALTSLNTYTISFATNGSCPDTATTIITITNAPDATFSYNSPFCPSGIDPLPVFPNGASAGVFSSSPAGLVFINTSTGLIDVSASTPGTYTVTNNIAAAGGCAATSSTNTVTINPGPTVNAGVNQTVCIGSPVTLSGSIGGTASSGTWSGGAGSFSSTTNLNAVYTPGAGETSATLTLTTDDPPGVCPAISANVVITFTQDTGSFSYSSGTYCITGTNPVPTTNGYTGTYSSTPAGLVFVSATTGEIDVTTSALDTYTVSFTTNGTCPNTSTVTITITNAPDATFSYNGPFCQSSINPMPQFGVGASAGIFSVTPAGLNFTSATTGEIDLATSAAGTYTITNNIPPSGGCAAATFTTAVTIDEKPTVNAGSNQTICDGSTVTLNGTIGGTAGSATWSGGTGSFSSTTNLNTVYTHGVGESSAMIILTTDDPTGPCTAAADTILITINAIPAAPTINGITICSGTSDTLTPTAPGGTYSWYDAATGGNLLATTANFVVPTLTTTATFYVESTIAGCTGPRTAVTVTVVPGPSVNAGNDQTVCGNNADVSLNGIVSNAGGGVWTSSGTGTFAPSDTDLVTIYTPGATDIAAGSATLLLTSTYNGGCAAETDTLVITITPAPLPDAGSDLFICKGTMSFTLNGAVGGSTSTGDWNTLGSGTFSPNNSTLNAVYNLSNADTTAGTVTLVLTSTNNGNCNVETDTLQVTLTTPAFAAAGTDTTICFNTSLLLNGIVSGGSTSGVWTTSGNGTFTPDSSNLNASYIPGSADVSSGTVTLILTPVNSCQNNPDTLTLTVLPAPVVNAGTDIIVCAGTNTVSLNGSVGGATTTGSWTTNGTGTFTPDQNTLNATYNITTSDSATGSVTLTLTSTNNGSCSAETDSVTITIVGNAVPFAGNDTTVCGNNSLITLNGSVTGGTGQGVWTSSGSGVFLPNDSALSVTYQPDSADINSGSVTFVLAPQNSCSPEFDTIVVSITPAPVVNAGTNQIVCNGDPTLTLTGTSNGVAGGVIWTTNGTGTFSSDTTLNSFYTFTGSDNDTLVFVISSTGNGNCISVSDTMMVIRDAGPTAAFSLNNSCAGQSVNFTDASSGTVNNWFWSFGTGDISTVQNPSYTYTSSGTFTVTLISSASINCADTVSQIIQVNPLPVAAMTFTANCAGTSATFIDNSTISQGTISSWNWNFGDSTSSSVQDPLHIFTVGGSYTVNLTVISDSGCTATTSQTVTVNPTPDAGFSYQTSCGSFEVTFTDTSSIASGTIASWSWNFGDSNTSTSQNPATTYADSGSYTVSLIVQSTAGCSDTATATVNVSSSVVAAFTPSGGVFNVGETIQLTNQSTGADTYLWSASTGDTSTTQNASFTFGTPDVYTIMLIATNSSGCADTVMYSFEIKTSGYAAATGFTPNGDNLNDAFYIRGGPFSEYELRVFNEWGQQIFMSNNQDTRWDGTFKGAPQPGGTYIYIFVGKTVSGEEVKLQNEINLIR